MKTFTENVVHLPGVQAVVMEAPLRSRHLVWDLEERQELAGLAGGRAFHGREEYTDSLANNDKGGISTIT